MNYLDYAVLFGTLLAIAAYGIWRTRGKRDLNHYLQGDRDYGWIVIGISVMATQASAATFLSMPGQGYQDGIGFIQNYFGAPFAMIIVSAIFLPIYRKLNIYTAYEYLGVRFDRKTRLLGASLFLVQRGIAAGITIWAPAIVLSKVFAWNLTATIILTGTVVILYTVVGGSEAVTLTQKYQFMVIIAGMVTAFFVLLYKLPATLRFSDAVTLAGASGKLNAVNFSTDYRIRYTFWSGLLGGMFLALSYFGTDQTQVQRYISGPSLRESRMGLIFNAILKIPMQFFILMLGAMLFVFYQFEKPPLFFNQVELRRVEAISPQARGEFESLEQNFSQLHAQRQENLQRWLASKESAGGDATSAALQAVRQSTAEIEKTRAQTKALMTRIDEKAITNDADYVFISFILKYLPHGLIGLLVTVFFAATLASKAGELNALASTTVVDVYKHLIKPRESDRHYVLASKAFTAGWGIVAIYVAMVIAMTDNIIQFGNIIASLFYGVILGLFIIGFAIPRVKGTAVFFGSILAQIAVLLLYHFSDIGYLWYNVIGPVLCLGFSFGLQYIIGFDAGSVAVLPAAVAIEKDPSAP